MTKKTNQLHPWRYWFLTSFALSSLMIALNSLSSSEVSSDYSTGVTDVIVSFAKAVLPPVDIVIIPVESIEIVSSNPQNEIFIGSSFTLTTTFTPSNTTDQSIIWTSSDSDVVGINSAGEVRAFGLGEAIVTATTSNALVFSTVTMRVIELPSISDFEINAYAGNQPRSEVEKDTSLRVQIENPVPANASIDDVIFSSSDENILTIQSLGIIQGKNVGDATIYAQVGSVTKSLTITVVDEIDVDIPTQIHLDGEPIAKVGRPIQLTYDFGNIEPTDKQVTFQSSHPWIAGVDQLGLVTPFDFPGLEAQAVTMSIVANGNPQITDSISIQIQKVFPESIIITNIDSIEASRTLSITPMFSPTDTTDKQIIYTSTQPDVATVSVNGSIGVVFAKSIGVTTINARSVMDATIETTFTIEVVQPTLLTPSVIASIHTFVRKGIGHIGLNLWNGILGFLTFYAWFKKDKNQYLILSSITGFALGFIFEGLQFFAEGRSPEWMDGVYNTMGYLIAQLLLFAIFVRYRQKRSIKEPKKLA